MWGRRSRCGRSFLFPDDGVYYDSYRRRHRGVRYHKPVFRGAVLRKNEDEHLYRADKFSDNQPASGGGGFLLNRRILTALKTPDNILEDAVLYLEIYFCGLPFLFMYNILSAMFNALGKSKIPLCLLVFSSVLNVILDLYAVRVLFWGVAGVAAATVAAQGISALISFGILLLMLKRYETEERAKLYDAEMLVRGTKIAIPSIIQQSIVSIGMLLVQSVVNVFGSSVLAGYSAGMRIESICIVPMIATGNAVSTFTAQNLGAGQPERVKKAIMRDLP